MRTSLTFALVLIALAPDLALATTYVWNKNVAGPTAWNASANWTPNTGFPSLIDDVANLNNNISANNAISMGAAVTVGSVNIGDSSGNNYFTINSGSALTFDVLSGSALITRVATGTGVDAINTAITLNDDITVTVNSANGSLAIGGIIGGAGKSITKSGVGTLTLSGANTFTGPVTVSGGILSINSINTVANANPLGKSSAVASNLLLGNGTSLQYKGGSASCDRSFTVNGTAAGHSVSLDASGTGALNLSSTASLEYGTADQTRTLILTGSSIGNNMLAASIGDNGSGAVSLSKTGAGVWLLAGNNTYSGTTTATGGVLDATVPGALQNYGVAGKIIFNGGAIGGQIGGSGWTTTQIDTLLANATKTSGALAIDTSNGTLVQWTIFTGGAGNNFGSLGLAKLGANTLVLDQANTYTGTTSVNGGTLKAGIATVTGVSGAFGVNSAVTMANVADVILDLNGYETQVGSIAGGGTTGGNITLGGAPLTVGANNTSTSYGGAISGMGNGSALVKIGTGDLTLSGNNTYSGNTTISQGTLTMTSNVIPNSPTIFIGNGATLSGSGSFTLAANQVVTGTGATGFVTMTGGTTTSLLTSGNNTISSSSTLTLSRLEVRGTGNAISGGAITSGVNGSRRGLLVGNISDGILTISGGTFTSNSGSAAPDVIGTTGGRGVLIINGGSYINTANIGTLSFGNNNTASLGGRLTLSSGSATINTLILNSSSTTGQGIINLDGGTFTVSAITVTSGATNQINFNGGQFVASATIPAFSGLTLNVKDGGAKIDTGSYSFAISDALLNSGSGGLTKSGTGTLTLSGSNTYIGGTAISDGTLTMGHANALGSTSAPITVNGGTLNMASFSPTIGNLTGSGGVISGSSGTRTFTIGNGDYGGGTYAGSIQNGVGGTTAITKTGTGTITFSGANSYTGVTAINGGKLMMTTTGSGASAITIADTAGCVLGVQIAAADGQWASTGDLTVGGVNSEIDIDYGSTAPSTTIDPIKITTLNVIGFGTLKILCNDLNQFTVGQTYPLINGTTAVPANADSYTGLNLSLPAGMTGHLKTVNNHVQLVVDSLPPHGTLFQFISE